MRVYVYPADLEACGYYRLTWAAQALQAQGYDVKLIHPNNPHRVTGETDEAGNLKSVRVPSDADVLVFQRVTSKIFAQAIAGWRSQGVAVVLDIDDDLSAISPTNPAWTALHPRSIGLTADYDWNATVRNCKAATYVTTSSDALIRRYAPQIPGKSVRGQVLHNLIPQVLLDIKHDELSRTIGWGGSVRTHMEDPGVMGQAMAQLQRDGYTFRIVGPTPGVRKAFALDRDPDITGGIPIDRYPHALARLAVGIAPLADTRFNAAKSWLKPLEYAAVGVPCVMSPRAEYMKIHQLGIGLVADKPRDWVRQSKRLLDNDELRVEMSEAGRAVIREKLTIEANAWRWWEAWTRALQLQRGEASDPFRRPIATTAGQRKRGPQAS